MSKKKAIRVTGLLLSLGAGFSLPTMPSDGRPRGRLVRTLSISPTALGKNLARWGVVPAKGLSVLVTPDSPVLIGSFLFGNDGLGRVKGSGDWRFINFLFSESFHDIGNARVHKTMASVKIDGKVHQLGGIRGFGDVKDAVKAIREFSVGYAEKEIARKVETAELIRAADAGEGVVLSELLVSLFAAYTVGRVEKFERRELSAALIAAPRRFMGGNSLLIELSFVPTSAVATYEKGSDVLDPMAARSHEGWGTEPTMDGAVEGIEKTAEMLKKKETAKKVAVKRTLSSGTPRTPLRETRSKIEYVPEKQEQEEYFVEEPGEQTDRIIIDRVEVDDFILPIVEKVREAMTEVKDEYFGDEMEVAAGLAKAVCGARVLYAKTLMDHLFSILYSGLLNKDEAAREKRNVLARRILSPQTKKFFEGIRGGRKAYIILSAVARKLVG